MKRIRLIRALIMSSFIAAALILIYFAFIQTAPELIELLKQGNEGDIEAYLRRSGSYKGMIFTALLQMVQVFSVFLPGAPIQIAAGVVYGIWRGFFICHLSGVLANFLVFYYVRNLGGKLDKWMPVDKNSSRLDKLRQSNSATYVTVMACLIPILPNGFIPYAMAKTDITPLKFTLAMWFGSLFPVFILCTCGNRILRGDYLFAILLCTGLFLAVIALYFLQPSLSRLAGRIKARLIKGRKN